MPHRSSSDDDTTYSATDGVDSDFQTDRGAPPNGNSKLRGPVAGTGSDVDEKLTEMLKRNTALQLEIEELQLRCPSVITPAKENEIIMEQNDVRRRFNAVKDENTSLKNILANQAPKLVESSRFVSEQAAFRHEQEGRAREIKLQARKLHEDREMEMSEIRRLQLREMKLLERKKNPCRERQHLQELRDECEAKDKVIERLEAQVATLEKREAEQKSAPRRRSIPQVDNGLAELRAEYTRLRAELDALNA